MFLSDLRANIMILNQVRSAPDLCICSQVNFLQVVTNGKLVIYLQAKCQTTFS